VCLCVRERESVCVCVFFLVVAGRMAVTYNELKFKLRQ
jgi:hypothetical protein